MGEMTHLDSEGLPRMVDVSDKPDTRREAVAGATVRMKPETLQRIKSASVAKGDVLATARLAGIMAAKRTPELIPLCHSISIGEIRVDFHLDESDSTVKITALVKSTGKTGVEMEALTAVSVAALTIYDMCKSVERGIVIDGIRLIRKSGGKSGVISLDNL